MTHPDTLQISRAVVEPVEWKHDCSALCVNNLRLWVDRCPHCGKPRTETTPPATQSALTAALSDCRTCQHLSEAWGVCEARPKCVGGEQYVYFPEKQLWDKTPRNDGQAAHQEMREALYAEFNSAVGRHMISAYRALPKWLRFFLCYGLMPLWLIPAIVGCALFILVGSLVVEAKSAWENYK